jgi:mRNA interferase HigB
VISKRELFRKSLKYPDARIAIQTWAETASQAAWTSLAEIRRSFPATDMIGKLAIFNVKGNSYRLIVRVEFAGQRIYVKEFLTHAEYDKGAWKKWL